MKREWNAVFIFGFVVLAVFLFNYGFSGITGFYGFGGQMAAALEVNLVSPANNTNSTNSSWSFEFSTNETGTGNCSIYTNSTGTFESQETLYFSQGGVFNLTSIPDGSFQWYVNCTNSYDEYNIVVSDSWNFLVDANAPSISEANNSAYYVVYGNSFLHDFNVTDLFLKNISIDNSDFWVNSSSGEVFNLSVLSVGNYSFSLNASDASGHSLSKRFYVIVYSNVSREVQDDTEDEIDLQDESDLNLTLFVNESVNMSLNVTKKVAFQVQALSGKTALKSAIIDIDSNSSTRLQWAIVKIFYEDSDLPANFDESTLRMYFYNESSQGWELVSGSGVDTTNNYVYGNVSHFSEYGLFGDVVVTDDGGDDDGGGGGSSGDNEIGLYTIGSSSEEITIEEGNFVYIRFGAKYYRFFLLDYSGFNASVSVSDGGSNYTFSQGDIIYDDLDGDGMVDVSIVFLSSYGGSVSNVRFKFDTPTGDFSEGVFLAPIEPGILEVVEGEDDGEIVAPPVVEHTFFEVYGFFIILGVIILIFVVGLVVSYFLQNYDTLKIKKFLNNVLKKRP